MNNIFSRKNRTLLTELVRTDFKLRYQNSALGYAWTLLRPLFLFMILYIVFVRVLKIGDEIPHAPVYLLLGIVLWNFFTEMTAQSLSSIVNRGDLIRKISIPRWIIVLSTSVSALINLFLNLLIVTVFMVLNHVDLLKTSLLMPLILIEIYAFALGASLLLSALYVKYRDVNYIWEVGMQGMFYITPILYPLSRIHNVTVKKLLFLNPMAQAIQDARYSLVTHKSITAGSLLSGSWYMYIPYVVVVVVLVAGVAYFRSQSKYFAENI